MPPKKVFLLLLFLAGITSTALALIISDGGTATKTPAEVAAAPPVQIVDGQTEPLKLESLWPQLRANARALGDRLEKVGKERLTLAGTLARGNSSQSNQFLIAWEYPGRLRLEELKDGRSRALVFDGSKAASFDGTLTTDDEALLETILYDTPEHLFVSQMRGAATRHLGSRFRLTDDQKNGAATYDIYEVTEPVTVGGQTRRQTRQYLFNSDTHLLERVRYEVARSDSVTKIEVLYTDWRKVGGQMIPGRIQRTEDGTPVHTLTLSVGSARISPRAEDGLFQTPKDQ
jgi:hypothetical protein